MDAGLTERDFYDGPSPAAARTVPERLSAAAWRWFTLTAVHHRLAHVIPAIVCLTGCGHDGVARTITDSHVLPVVSVAISPDNSIIASVSTDDQVQLWDWQRNVKIAEFRGNLSVDFSADGRLVAAGAATHDDILVWDVVDSRQRARLQNLHTDGYAATAVRFFGDSGQLACGDAAGWVRVCDIGSRAETMSRRLVDDRGDGITALAVSKSGAMLAVGTYFGSIAILDAKTGDIVAPLWKAHEGDVGNIRALTFADRDRSLLSSGSGPEIRVWSAPTAKYVRRFDSGDAVSSFALNSEESVLATGSGVAVSLWKWGANPQLIELHRTRCSDTVAFSRDGKLLVCGGRGRGTSSQTLVLRVNAPGK